LRTLLAELSPGKKVLHLAPERALERTFMERRDLLYVTADLIRRRWLGKLGALTDLTSLAFRDNSFSLVLCSHVLEHVRDDHAALAEIARVVAFGATVLILVPTWKPWNSRRTLEFGMPHPRFDDHWRIYGSDLPARIEACGMRCAAVDLRAPLQRRAFERFALTDEVLFICVKPKIEGRKAAVASRPHTARIPCNLALLERPFRTSAQPCDRQAAGLEGGQGWAR
jgi:SAM-dependent methyltransferase